MGVGECYLPPFLDKQGMEIWVLDILGGIFRGYLGLVGRHLVIESMCKKLST